MNTKLMASVSVLALVLAGCASNEPKPLTETPEVKYKTAKVEAATSIIPDWYKKMPEKKGSIFTVGAAVAPDLQFAVDIATMNAKVDVAGYNPIEVDVFPSGTQYRAFVLLEYSDKEAAKVLFNRMRKDRMVYSRLRSNEAWKELEREVYKSEKSDEGKSLKNLEKIIKKSNEEQTVAKPSA